MHYDGGDYENAAKVGEALSRDHPKATGARQSAQIALASRIKLYQSANADEEKRKRMADVRRSANHLIDTWPKQPEAIQAAQTMIAVLASNGDINTAIEYLEVIPADSPKRGGAEMSILRASVPGILNETDTTRRKALIKRAKEIMERMIPKSVDKEQYERVKGALQRIFDAEK